MTQAIEELPETKSPEESMNKLIFDILELWYQENPHSDHAEEYNKMVAEKIVGAVKEFLEESG